MPGRMPERMSEYMPERMTSRWYVRNYVRIMDQGGDHSKKVIIGVSLEYLGGSGPPAVAVDTLIPITSI